MMIGTVHWFASKGQSFGFIDYFLNNQKAQVYVHYKSIGTSNLRKEDFRNGKWFRQLRKGDVVSFDIDKGFGVASGTQAINVEITVHAH